MKKIIIILLPMALQILATDVKVEANKGNGTVMNLETYILYALSNRPTVIKHFYKDMSKVTIQVTTTGFKTQSITWDEYTKKPIRVVPQYGPMGWKTESQREDPYIPSIIKIGDTYRYALVVDQYKNKEGHDALDFQLSNNEFITNVWNLDILYVPLTEFHLESPVGNDQVLQVTV